MYFKALNGERTCNVLGLNCVYWFKGESGCVCVLYGDDCHDDRVTFSNHSSVPSSTRAHPDQIEMHVAKCHCDKSCEDVRYFLVGSSSAPLSVSSRQLHRDDDSLSDASRMALPTLRVELEAPKRRLIMEILYSRADVLGELHGSVYESNTVRSSNISRVEMLI